MGSLRSLLLSSMQFSVIKYSNLSVINTSFSATNFITQQSQKKLSVTEELNFCSDGWEVFGPFGEVFGPFSTIKVIFTRVPTTIFIGWI